MITGPVVIDASVVVELLVDLGGADQADRLFDRLADDDGGLEGWAPDLIYAEVASALRKLVARRTIPASAGGRAIGQLAGLPIIPAGTAALLPDVWRLRGELTPYDACYVALARRLGATLVTADARLLRARAGSRDRVLHLAET